MKKTITIYTDNLTAHDADRIKFIAEILSQHCSSKFINHIYALAYYHVFGANGGAHNEK